MLRHVELIVLESVLVEPSALSVWTKWGSLAPSRPSGCASMTVAHEGKVVYSLDARSGMNQNLADSCGVYV